MSKFNIVHTGKFCDKESCWGFLKTDWRYGICIPFVNYPEM